MAHPPPCITHGVPLTHCHPAALRQQEPCSLTSSISSIPQAPMPQPEVLSCLSAGPKPVASQQEKGALLVSSKGLCGLPPTGHGKPTFPWHN